MVTKEAVIEALKLCKDPELQMDVWTLGLIYDIQIKEAEVYIKMTFTSLACPYGPRLVSNIYDSVRRVSEGREVNIDVVFEPPWKPSEEIMDMLGMSGEMANEGYQPQTQNPR